MLDVFRFSWNRSYVAPTTYDSITTCIVHRREHSLTDLISKYFQIKNPQLKYQDIKADHQKFTHKINPCFVYRSISELKKRSTELREKNEEYSYLRSLRSTLNQEMKRRQSGAQTARPVTSEEERRRRRILQRSTAAALDRKVGY